MNKNPKMIAGIAGLALMLILAVVLIVQMIPTIGEVQREMSLTPTPLPPVPDSVRAAGFVEEETPEPALGTGSWGDRVIKLQERLKELGYYNAEIDGQFGQGTKDAVIDFQEKNNLEADGYAGPATQEILYSDKAIANKEE